MDRLKKIASIHIGATFRSRVMVSAKGRVRVIQMKDLKSSTVDIDKAAYIESADIPRARQQVQAGDILFRSRGLTTTATLLTRVPERIIVSSPLFIIRTRPDMVIPEYLVWWINQPSSQAYFRSRSEGSLVKMVSKQVLENLQIDCPPIEKQKCITDFYQLMKREQVLLGRIKLKRKRYADAVMKRMASESLNDRSTRF